MSADPSTDAVAVLARPTGWWTMLLSDAHRYSRKSVVDRRTGSSSSLEDRVRRTTSWCVSGPGAARSGAAVFAAPGILVSNGWPDPDLAGQVRSEPPLVIDLTFERLTTTGYLRPGGPRNDRIRTAPDWTLEFEAEIHGRGLLVVATGHLVAEPPTEWSLMPWGEAVENRRSWLETAH